ncbi:alpha/beta hydrolase [Hydrogenovibrio thermophilus]|uniref:Alpha/beta fold hydrolase n=1 Tax=Hydrogenovibrio thermophilus TaxID=265883 RepID=A0A451G5A4_9GAMM|nr:alpha/beta fold hydrolase [Hydrogenovibrio thermophilus]QAB14684.1 alpha/beta fold hydrolase [Hydrogenovibrio thermophilus]
MKSSKFTDRISGAVGELEVRLTRPGDLSSSENAARRWVVLSHPHPQFGGTMDNKVVATLEKAFQGLGYGTLAYNFRGVGASEGEYDGGEGEQMDLVAVVNWLRDQEDVNELVLAGFSFGSYIALQQAEALQADALCTVAPPVSMYDFTGLSPTMPWVLIQGGQDEVIDSQEVLQWAMSRESVPDIFWRAQASHFFHRQLVWLKNIVTAVY